MEKKIKFDEIINFIYKSIKKNYSIECDSYGICIGHKREYTDDNGSTRVYNCFRFGWGMCENCLIIGVNSWGVNNDDYHYNLKINNPKDIARWNILIEDIKEYIFNKIERDFNNFFEEDNSKPTTIDDLDNDEE
jgi:hypothetical protein